MNDDNTLAFINHPELLPCSQNYRRNLTISGLDTFGVGTNDPLYTEGLGATLGYHENDHNNQYAEVHLERLANPGLPYQSDEEAANYNPYVSLVCFSY